MAGLLVHEWVAKSGGSEKVLDQMAAAYPDADLQVLWTEDPDRFELTLRETWIAKTPLRNHKAAALPFLPAVWRRLRTESRPDWLLVSSHLFAHHARVAQFPDVPKYVYSHTPARYIWEPELDHRGRGYHIRAASAFLKPLDRRRAQEASAIAANSTFTKQRIASAWHRDAAVIYPPVDTRRIADGGNWSDRLTGAEQDYLDSLPADFVLGASRFVPYKRLDLVVDCAEANTIPAVIAGAGPDGERLAARAADAKVPVVIVDRPSDAMLYALYQRSVAYVFPAVEDFGIMPVEAMATGTPVVVPDVGGAAESARMLSGGVTFAENTPRAWRAALDDAARIDRAGLPDRTHVLSNESFRENLRSWMSTQVA